MIEHDHDNPMAKDDNQFTPRLEQVLFWCNENIEHRAIFGDLYQALFSMENDGLYSRF